MNWIKLSDKLPEPSVDVLLTNGIDYYVSRTYIANESVYVVLPGIDCLDEECSWIHDGCGCDYLLTDYFTHWMPLPHL